MFKLKQEQKEGYNPFKVPVYACFACGAEGCRLWLLLSLAGNKLACCSCAEKCMGRKLNSHNLIGLGAPAVPKTDEVGFYNFIDIPEDGMKWWKSLPISTNPLDEPFV